MKRKKAKVSKTPEPQRKERDDRGKSQAEAQLVSIREMVAALQKAEDDNDDDAREDAEQRIHEDALSCETRSGWRTPGADPEADEEFRILLCWGGPACQIVGELDECEEPAKARLQYQDWFTPWQDYPLTSDDEEIILRYARTFYWG